MNELSDCIENCRECNHQMDLINGARIFYNLAGPNEKLSSICSFDGCSRALRTSVQKPPKRRKNPPKRYIRIARAHVEHNKNIPHHVVVEE